MADYVKLEDLAKLTQVPPRTGHYSEVITDTEYEKGLAINFGINGQVCGSKRIAMGRTIIPPHTANERHVHLSAEAAMYRRHTRARPSPVRRTGRATAIADRSAGTDSPPTSGTGWEST